MGGERPPGEGPRQLEGVVEEAGGGHHPVDEADGERLVGGHLAAGEDEVLGPGRPHQAGQALGGAGARDDAQHDLGLAELGRAGGDAEVTRQSQLAAPAEGVAGDRRDRHAGNGRHRIERLAEVAGDPRRLHRPAELGDVGPGGEDAVTAGHDHGAGRVGHERLGRRRQLGEQSGGEGVGRWVVEADQRHALVALLDHHERLLRLPRRCLLGCLPGCLLGGLGCLLRGHGRDASYSRLARISSAAWYGSRRRSSRASRRRSNSGPADAAWARSSRRRATISRSS